MDRFTPWVSFLLERRGFSSEAAVLSPEDVHELAREGASIADWVIFDAPPPNYTSDGLTIASRADLVIVVVRLGKTRRRELAELAELFAQQRIRPLGFVVIGSRGRKPYILPMSPTTAQGTMLRPHEQRSTVVSDDVHEAAGQS
jgi:hypothetical protein